MEKAASKFRAGQDEDGLGKICKDCIQASRPVSDPSAPKPVRRDTSSSKRTAVNNQIRAAKRTALKRGVVQFAKHLDVLRPFITPQTAERVEREAKQSHYSGLLGLADFDGQPTYIKGGQMKPYQIEGVAFLISLHDTGMLGGILGDEMGLGKTMQVQRNRSSFHAGMVYAANVVQGPNLVLVLWSDNHVPGVPQARA